MILPLHDLSADDPRIGGKARGLVLARAHGLRIPDGFVVPPGELPARLEEAAVSLGDELVVRSSANLEDLAAAAAPGVFLSLRDVVPEQVVAAVEAVRASAASPAALAYLAHGVHAGVAMAVLVQRQVQGILGTAYSRAPGTAGGAGHVLIELATGEPVLVDDVGTIRGALPGIAPAALLAIARAARHAEEALGRPADVEWVLGNDQEPWIVQARPIVAAPAAADAAEFEAAWSFARDDPDSLWTWDAAHNPDPLSPAQAGLVELVDAAGAAPYRQRVVLGYLYSSPTGASPPASRIAPADLPHAWTHAILPALEHALGAMRDDDLEATLAAYVDFYRTYTLVLSPSLPRTPVAILALAVPGGDLSPVWDVAAPTYGEAGHAPATVTVTTLAEADDLLFARAQTGVRRALLALAARWSINAPDIFQLPLEEVRRGCPRDADERAAAARALSLRQRSMRPPRRVLGGQPLHDLRPTGEVLHGRGAGGTASGVVARLDASAWSPDGPRPPAGAIVVCPTFIPPMAPLVARPRAIISEHGGLLGHGAAMARELGIPCVVGCAGASELRDGDRVWLDGNSGLVIVEERAG